MSRTIWTLPVPSTSLIYGVSFDVLPQHRCRLSMVYEVESGERTLELIFNRVEVYKCSYFSSCTADQIASAYDRVIAFDDSDLLRGAVKAMSAGAHEVVDIRHFAIFFDDGPYYEFICRGFSIVEDGHLVPLAGDA